MPSLVCNTNHSTIPKPRLRIPLSKITILLLCTSAPLAAQNDKAVVLAQILSDRGTITAADLARVETTDEHSRLLLLAGILRAKGLLNAADMARLSLPQIDGSAPVKPLAVEASARSLPAGQAPSGGSTSQVSGVPVTTKKQLPVSLYGTLLFTAGFNTANFNFLDVPMVANKQGSDPVSDDKAFYGSARQTRLGLNLDPLQTLGGELSGRFEFDMMGGSAPYSNGVNMSYFRLRLAYGRVDWDHFAVEAGQDWSVFAPLNPTSLNQFGIPEFTSSGNAWARVPQLRFEAKTKNSSSGTLLWQFAAADPNMGDYSTTSISVARPPGIGERGRMPSLESRLAFTKTYGDRDFTIGFSGHYGRGKNAGTINNSELQPPVDSWGAAIDYSLPFTKFFNVTGELYEGRALGIYAVANGEAVGAVGTPGAHGVLSRGGWVQGQFNFTKQWQLNLAYGVDAPDAAELPVGNRNRNQQYMANIINKLTRNINLSIEYRRILTDYRNQVFANERGDHIDLGMAYLF